ncbi:MAG: hypothetical protein E6Q97_09435 [Desulfurellales bacterium]|nr:MAG: hypothetical protein E6Q97_09435 [Desulfurellales bacterium]
MSAIETSKPTPGPWFVDGSGASAIVRGGDMTIVAVRHRLDKHTHEANARLIAEAGTVNHETGKTPRQLADELAEESAIREHMAGLLAGAIVAIRGPETAGTTWGYHDLPERCAELVGERDTLRGEVERLRAELTKVRNIQRKHYGNGVSTHVELAMWAEDLALAEQQP